VSKKITTLEHGNVYLIRTSVLRIFKMATYSTSN